MTEKLPPDVLSKHLRDRAKLMRECYGSRCTQDYEDAADCIDDLRFGNTPRADLHGIRHQITHALQLIRNDRRVRAMNVLSSLQTYLDMKLAPIEDDER